AVDPDIANATWVNVVQAIKRSGGLPDPDVTPELMIDVVQHPDDGQDGKNDVCPKPFLDVLCAHIRNVVNIHAMLNIFWFVASGIAIYRHEDGEDDDQHGREDFEEHAEVADEEVGVQAAFLDDLKGWGCDHGLDPADETVWRYGDAFSLGYEAAAMAAQREPQDQPSDPSARPPLPLRMEPKLETSTSSAFTVLVDMLERVSSRPAVK
ncbi:233_t:CDS:2, partial [Scutellospora calospora]